MKEITFVVGFTTFGWYAYSDYNPDPSVSRLHLMGNGKWLGRNVRYRPEVHKIYFSSYRNTVSIIRKNYKDAKIKLLSKNKKMIFNSQGKGL